MKKLLCILISFTCCAFIGCLGKNKISQKNKNKLEINAQVKNDDSLNFSIEKFNKSKNSKNKDSAYFFYMESLANQKAGNLDQAIDCLKKATEADPNSSYLKSELIGLYLDNKDFKNSAIIAEELFNKNPNNLGYLILYARLKQELKETAKAIDAYEKILKKDPKREDVYLALGNLYLEEKRNDKALEIFTKMLNYSKPSNKYIANFYIGKAYLAQNNLEKAEENFKKTLKSKPHLQEPLIELIKIYEKQNKKQDIIDIYKKLIANNPNDIRNHIELAYFYNKNGYLAEASKIFQKLGKESQKDTVVIKVILKNYVAFKSSKQEENKNQNSVDSLDNLDANAKKDCEKAIYICEEILKASPNSLDINYALGFCFENLKKHDKAIESFKKIPKNSNFYPNAIVSVASQYHQQKKTQEAINYLEGILKENKDNVDFITYLSSFYEDTEQFEKAHKLIIDALQNKQNDTVLLFRLGVVYDKWGKKQDCINIMKKLLELEPKDPNTLNYLGYTYADLGKNLDEAEKLILEALKYKPNDGFITDSLGWVYYQKGLYDKALEYLDKAIKLVPDEPIILEHLGDTYFKLNNLDKAFEFYKKSFLKKEKESEKIELKKKVKKSLGKEL